MYISLLGIGPEWKPTILNSATEFNIIVANMKGLGMVTDFYIGGSTNIFTNSSAEFGSGNDTTEVEFADYLPAWYTWCSLFWKSNNHFLLVLN